LGCSERMRVLKGCCDSKHLPNEELLAALHIYVKTRKVVKAGSVGGSYQR
jgi:hypothetical protein